MLKDIKCKHILDVRKRFLGLIKSVRYTFEFIEEILNKNKEFINVKTLDIDLTKKC